MSILDPFDDARHALSLAPGEEDAAAIKRAYRRAVLAHPPDTDPEGFRRIRDAYELLRDPWTRLDALLVSPLPMAAPPAAPSEIPAAPRGATAIAVLRLAVQLADTEAWLAAPAAKTPRRPKAKETP
jgi:hypothetical protein